jgi:hypothetical protein
MTFLRPCSSPLDLASFSLRTSERVGKPYSTRAGLSIEAPCPRLAPAGAIYVQAHCQIYPSPGGEKMFFAFNEIRGRAGAGTPAEEPRLAELFTAC